MTHPPESKNREPPRIGPPVSLPRFQRPLFEAVGSAVIYDERGLTPFCSRIVCLTFFRTEPRCPLRIEYGAGFFLEKLYPAMARRSPSRSRRLGCTG